MKADEVFSSERRCCKIGFILSGSCGEKGWNGILLSFLIDKSGEKE